MSQLISVEQAMASDVRFVDARWYLPNDPRDGEAAYREGHLPGAVYFPIDEIAGEDDNHPHRAPSAQQVADWLGRVGITPDDLVVVYDETGGFSAPRVWFLLRMIGHEKVKVMNGGLHAWRAAGGEVTPDLPSLTSTSYRLTPQADIPLVSRDAVTAAIKDGSAQIIDARPAGRFSGKDPEPRPGLSSGHMRGAISIPHSELFNEDGYLSGDELNTHFQQKGLDPARPVIASCGSGVSACVLLLGLAEAGWPATAQLYDGSWIDWARHPEAEIIKDQP